MLKTRVIIESRIKELEEELASKETNDILSIKLIEADLDKLRHLLNYEEGIHNRGFAIPYNTKTHSIKGRQ